MVSSLPYNEYAPFKFNENEIKKSTLISNETMKYENL